MSAFAVDRRWARKGLRSIDRAVACRLTARFFNPGLNDDF
jgi:hypothetical protein